MTPYEDTLLGAQDNTAGAEQKETQPTTTPAPVAPAEEAPRSENKPPEQEQSKDGTQPQQRKPQTQEYDVKLPDGVQAAPELLAEFKGLAKEIGLSQEHAQRLVDLQGKAVLAAAQEQLDAYKRMAEEWAAETKKMLGTKYESELAYAAKARDRFASPALVQLLTDSGLANHPEMVRLFIEVGRRISEDTPESGKSASTPRDVASIMYPTMKG